MRFLSLGVALAFILIALLQPQPALAKRGEAEIIEPSGRWVFEYAEDHCAFRRSFGLGDDRFFVEFRQYAPGQRFDLIVMSEKRKAFDRDLRFRFAPFDDVRKPVTAYEMRNDAGHQGHLASGFFLPFQPKTEKGGEAPRLTEAALEKWISEVEAIEFVSGFGKPVRLETGSFDELLEIRKHCLNTLIASWGLDPAQQANCNQLAAPREFEQWARHVRRAYPRNALRQGRVGATRLRVMIDESGKATDCTSLANIADVRLVEAACKQVLRHAQFDPALDQLGNPMPGYFVLHVNFQIS